MYSLCSTVCLCNSRSRNEPLSNYLIIAKHLQRHKMGVGEFLVHNYCKCRLKLVWNLQVVLCICFVRVRVCVYLKWSTWSLMESEYGFALCIHEKQVCQKLILAQVLSKLSDMVGKTVYFGIKACLGIKKQNKTRDQIQKWKPAVMRAANKSLFVLNKLMVTKGVSGEG